MKLQKLLCAVLVLLVMMQLPLAASAASADAERCIQDMLNYYRYYQTDASSKIDDLVEELKEEDRKLGVAWEKMMDSWRWVDQYMPVSDGVLPYGLPQDDSLAIVVMGYGLNANGTMKSELQDRLIVALSSAQRYPNAYIVCTGGATAKYSNNTEAGVMAQWLENQGISSSRIIVENRSYSTTANAQNTYKILVDSYPQIRSLAVISSNYHIYRSALAFQAMSDYASSVNGTEAIPVVATASCWTDREDRESLTSHAEVLAEIAGLDLQYQRKPGLDGSQTSKPSVNTGSQWESYWEGAVPPASNVTPPSGGASGGSSNNSSSSANNSGSTDAGSNAWGNPWLSTDSGASKPADTDNPWQ